MMDFLNTINNQCCELGVNSLNTNNNQTRELEIGRYITTQCKPISFVKTTLPKSGSLFCCRFIFVPCIRLIYSPQYCFLCSIVFVFRKFSNICQCSLCFSQLDINENIIYKIELLPTHWGGKLHKRTANKNVVDSVHNSMIPIQHRKPTKNLFRSSQARSLYKAP